MTNSCVEELTRRDDLLLLFNVISSNCPERNKPWRVQASDMLILIGKHSLQSAIQCIHSNQTSLSIDLFCIFLFVSFFFYNRCSLHIAMCR